MYIKEIRPDGQELLWSQQPTAHHRYYYRANTGSDTRRQVPVVNALPRVEILEIPRERTPRRPDKATDRVVVGADSTHTNNNSRTQ